MQKSRDETWNRCSLRPWIESVAPPNTTVCARDIDQGRDAGTYVQSVPRPIVPAPPAASPGFGLEQSTGNTGLWMNL